MNATYDVYFLLVDDNLNMVTRDGVWGHKVKVASEMVGYRNTQLTPQRDYYSMLDGRVITIVYNTAVVIDPLVLMLILVCFQWLILSE